MSTMFVLSGRLSGVAVDIKLNGVRQHRGAVPGPVNLSARLNLWLVPGANRIRIEAAGLAPDIALSEPRSIRVDVQRGVQGQPLPHSGHLMRSEVDTARLQALQPGRLAEVLDETFDAGAVPWRPWRDELDPAPLQDHEVYDFIERYWQALRAGDIATILRLHELQFGLVAARLPLSRDELAADLARMLSSRPADAWQRVPQAAMVVNREGEGRLCRVEGPAGQPVFKAGTGPRTPAISLLLARGRQGIGVIG